MINTVDKIRSVISTVIGPKSVVSTDVGSTIVVSKVFAQKSVTLLSSQVANQNVWSAQVWDKKSVVSTVV